jgi:amidase
MQTIRKLAAAVRSGEITSEALVRDYLDRIAQVNGALNAMVFDMGERAMTHAANADTARMEGAPMGPLHGVPITIKDSLDTKDATTTWGTLGRKDVRPGQDATCVARLRDAGAIILGKTNTPEFTLSFRTDNLVYGRTNNPYDVERTPGGSSGGAAALIAAGASLLDIGTDTGGSIRLPSHFCGISGIKPTTGRVPCTGNALPTSGLTAPASQPGPMAACVDDLAYVLPIIAGPDLIDPHAVDATLGDPANVDLSRLRVSYHADNGIRTPEANTITVINNVTQAMRPAVAAVSEARPTGVEMAQFIASRVFSADAGDMVDMLLEDSHTTTPSPLLRPAGREPIDPIDAREFAQVITLWHNFKSSMLSFWNDFDVLICPVNAKTAALHSEPVDMADYSYTIAYNLTGWPSTVIRAGTDDKGLPIGIQVIARPFREDISLAVAGWLQNRMGPFQPPAINAFPAPAQAPNDES